jgi:tryptophan synthase alpha chain
VSAPNSRIEDRFKALARQGRGGLVTFVTAGDPDGEISAAILRGLPGAGADIIELGMPFSDPMADGPAIQAASKRALAAGQTMTRTLAMVRDFRTIDGDTPVVLMGYYNPIYSYGVDRFTADAAAAGVDGLIVVDLPPEESDELGLPASKAGIDLIRLATPTSDDARLALLTRSAGGFVYYVSVAGVTGTTSAEAASVAGAVARIRRHTQLPVAVGFGIRTPDQAADIARIADAAVVGSAIVEIIADGVAGDASSAGLADRVLEFVAALSAGVGRARTGMAKESISI